MARAVGRLRCLTCCSCWGELLTAAKGQTAEPCSQTGGREAGKECALVCLQQELKQGATQPARPATTGGAAGKHRAGEREARQRGRSRQGTGVASRPGQTGRSPRRGLAAPPPAASTFAPAPPLRPAACRARGGAGGWAHEVWAQAGLAPGWAAATGGSEQGSQRPAEQPAPCALHRCQLGLQGGQQALLLSQGLLLSVHLVLQHLHHVHARRDGAEGVLC